MGTRSRIGVMHGDNCKSVYCHWDGYLDYTGRILLEHYDSSKANHLVKEEIGRGRKSVAFVMDRFGDLQEMPWLEAGVGEDCNDGYILLEIFDVVAEVFCNFDSKRG